MNKLDTVSIPIANSKVVLEVVNIMSKFGNNGQLLFDYIGNCKSNTGY